MKILPDELIHTLKNDFSAGFFTQEASELQIYGKDWTKVYAPKPSGVAFPRTTEDVVKLVKLCVLHNVAIVPSGGRTGLAGGAMATQGEIVLSFAKMNQMGPVDELAQTVRVQAGAVTEAVHKHCEPYGLTWPIDFGSKGSSHVGGNISTNAGGVKVIHYGMTRNWVLGLQVVTMDGNVLELNGALEKNNTGMDLRQLFIGSEGTLGIVTEATLKLARVPGALEVFFFGVEDMSAVLELFKAARRGPFNLTAFECMDQECLDITVPHFRINPPLASRTGAYALLEVERPKSDDAQKVLDSWLEGLFEKGLVQDGTQAQSPKAARDFWILREGIGEALFTEGLVHKNDISLPVSELEVFVKSMREMFKRHHPEFRLFVFGHIGDGNLHVNTMKPAELDREKFLHLCHEADRELFALVQKHHGSISAEHGIGLLKKEWLKYSRTPAELEIFRAMKKIFDPKNLLNPGKVISF